MSYFQHAGNNEHLQIYLTLHTALQFVFFNSFFKLKIISFICSYLRLCSETDENLLSALLQCLPNIISAKSAGAVRWYFTLLSQLSQHDPQNVAESCAKLLEPLANAFGNKCSGPSAVLCTRLFSNTIYNNIELRIYFEEIRNIIYYINVNNPFSTHYLLNN